MIKFDRFPTGKDRKAVIKKTIEGIEFMKSKGNKIKPYTWLDSHANYSSIEPGQRGEPFFRSFREIIPKEYDTLTSFIEESLKEKDGKAVGVEFGGVGSNFF